MTRDHGFSAIGVVLNDPLPPDVAEELAESGAIECVGSFSGDAYPVDDAGFTQWNKGESYDDESLYFVNVCSSSCLFKPWFSDMDELVKAMRKTCGEIPELAQIDLDVRKHLRHIVGTYYG